MMRTFLLLVLLLTAIGCESREATRGASYTLAELPCAIDDDGAWASAPLPDLSGEVDEACAWLPFPGRSTLELEHGLGRAPVDMLIYVAFLSTGESSTLASGDPGRILGVDASHVLLENTTEQEFFVRVVLR